MSDKIKILVVEPMKPCEVRGIPDTLDAMRQIVGGDIEAVTSLRDASAIVCNENGKLLDLPHNRPLLDESGLLPLDILHGTFFITGVSGERFVSLTDEQIQHYKNLYDNAAVLTAERPENQAEIAPESVMLNFAVDCQLSFRFTRDGQEAAESKDAFISHIRIDGERFRFPGPAGVHVHLAEYPHGVSPENGTGRVHSKQPAIRIPERGKRTAGDRAGGGRGHPLGV